MRNVQRRVHSGLGCQCVGIDFDTTDIRAIFSEPVILTGTGRTMGTELGGATRRGAIGVPALTGVSFSLKAVSGWSAMGTMDTKVTMVIRETTSAHRLRFTTGTPQAKRTILQLRLTCQALIQPMLIQPTNPPNPPRGGTQWHT